MGEHELVKADENALANLASVTGGLQKFDDSQFEAVSKAADYLCRIQLCGSNSTLTKLNKIQKGHYAYVVSKDDFKDLGDSVDVLALCWRPKALDMSGDTPMSFYDVNSVAFKEVAERSGQQNSNCTYGPEYLVYIPVIGKFATLHYGSKTSRKDAKDMHALLNKPATLTHRVVGPNDKNQIWETIVTKPCSSQFNIPPMDVIRDTVEKLMAEAAQKAPEKAETGGRSR